MILHQALLPPRLSATHDYQGLAPFCRAPPLFVQSGQLWHATERAAGHAAAAIPTNESQGAGIRPGARIGRAHHWQQKGSCSAHTLAPTAPLSRRARDLPCLSPKGGSTFAAVEVSNSCIATAPRRRRRNKPKTSHGAGRLRHPINTGRRRESCRYITENEGQAQNDTKEEARYPTKGQNYERGAHPPSAGGRRALGGLDVKATASCPSTTADDGRENAILDVSAPY